jgi:hypothetical protein
MKEGQGQREISESQVANSIIFRCIATSADKEVYLFPDWLERRVVSFSRQHGVELSQAQGPWSIFGRIKCPLPPNHFCHPKLN